MRLSRPFRHQEREPEATAGPPARGRREWDDRYSGLARGKRNWQLAALGLLAIDGLLTGGLIHLATQSRVSPFVVEVDRLGQAVAFGPAEQLRKTDERLIRYQLNLFIRDVRSVFSDAEVQKTVINRAYGCSKDAALGFLNDYFKKSNPFLREAEGTVTVQVQSVLRLSPSSWQVQWRETPIAAGGRVGQETAWQAVLGVELTPPETTDLLLVNPLGLYVTEINWTQVL
ncbi:MAG: type IV secretion system protein [Holophagales bacterium]|nr:MAG: type IV secretion system protein [Holophagales bacterium]